MKDAMDHEQGTKAWIDAKLGNVSASRISEVVTKARKGQKDSSMRANYRAQLVCEILTGKASEDQFVSYWMKRGLELEPLARAEYELATGETIRKVGFLLHPRISRAGASPDGLIGEDGLVQFKIVKTACHLDWLMARIVPVEHRPQMYFEMACTGRQWNDFVSYEPNLPPQHQLFVARLRRDEVAINEIEIEVEKFNAEIDAIIAKLQAPEDLTQRLERSVQALQ